MSETPALDLAHVEDEDFTSRLARLTERERQVLELVAAGVRNREIASTLGISPRTVEVFKSRMREKMRARDLPELLRMLGSALGSG
ncbi:MAG: helix-turn-helix domain-containing protein [Betaproteobacteria bacterium]|nr:helix-turn-helix domain-containing protein [Betaproteobacteria bacterium]